MTEHTPKTPFFRTVLREADETGIPFNRVPNAHLDERLDTALLRLKPEPGQPDFVRFVYEHGFRKRSSFVVEAFSDESRERQYMERFTLEERLSLLAPGFASINPELRSISEVGAVLNDRQIVIGGLYVARLYRPTDKESKLREQRRRLEELENVGIGSRIMHVSGAVIELIRRSDDTSKVDIVVENVDGTSSTETVDHSKLRVLRRAGGRVVVSVVHGAEDAARVISHGATVAVEKVWRRDTDKSN